MGSYGPAQWVKVSAECSSLYYYICIRVYTLYIILCILCTFAKCRKSTPVYEYVGVDRTHKARDAMNKG